MYIYIYVYCHYVFPAFHVCPLVTLVSVIHVPMSVSSLVPVGVSNPRLSASHVSCFIFIVPCTAFRVFSFAYSLSRYA